MTERIRVIVTTLAMGVACQAADVPKGEVALRKALEQQWTELTVSMMIDQGCVAPIYIGLRITRTEAGVFMARWQRDTRGERLGPLKEFDAPLLPKFLEAVAKHYSAAREFEDIYERMAKLKDDEARAQVWADAVKAAGGQPPGGFAATGIDIRITLDGAEKHFIDHFGSTGFAKWERWLTTQGAKYQHQ